MREILRDDLARLHKVAGPWDVVFFTGDLTQRGTDEEFGGLDQTLTDLWALLRELGSNPTLVTVPGNHDLIRPDARKPAMRVLQAWGSDPEVIKEFWSDRESEYRQVVDKAFASYLAWSKRRLLPRPEPYQEGMLPGDFSATLTKDGAKIGVVGLNTAFLQLTGADYLGKLDVHVAQLHAACGGDGAAWTRDHHLCLLLTHHPTDWLRPAGRQTLNGEIAPPGRFAIHLFGHMHEGTTVTQSIGGSAPRRAWQGASLFGLESFGTAGESRSHGYSAGRLDFAEDRASLRIWPRVGRRRPSGEWRIVPDVDAFALEDDGGTQPEEIKLRTPYRPPPAPPPAQPPAPATAPAPLTGVRDALASLLSTLFSRRDLERFLAKDPRAAEVMARLPPDLADKREMASLALDGLLRAGLVDEGFFERLRGAGRGAGPSIAAVHAQWTGAAAPESTARPSVTAPPPSLRIATLRAMGASVELDRSAQWLSVLTVCRRDDHALFFLYGHIRQSLRLFLERVRYFLTEESGRPHRVVSVPFKLGYTYATTGDEWATRLAAALAPGRAGTPAEHLAEAARHRALLVILGLRPLPGDKLAPDQRDGLRELISETLPKLLADARPASPVRVLLAVDSAVPEDPFFTSVDTWGRAAEETRTITYSALAEVHFPQWYEVEQYLKDFKPRPPADTIARIHGEYEALVADDGATFQQIADEIDRDLTNA